MLDERSKANLGKSGITCQPETKDVASGIHSARSLLRSAKCIRENASEAISREQRMDFRGVFASEKERKRRANGPSDR